MKTKRTAHKYVFLAQIYCIVNELGRNDEEITRMKNAIHELHQSKDADNTPIGCISLQAFLNIVDQGRDSPIGIHNFHFIRIIAEYERRCEYEGKYLLAKEFMDHRSSLQRNEETRQLAIIKTKQ